MPVSNVYVVVIFQLAKTRTYVLRSHVHKSYDIRFPRLKVSLGGDGWEEVWYKDRNSVRADEERVAWCTRALSVWRPDAKHVYRFIIYTSNIIYYYYYYIILYNIICI